MVYVTETKLDEGLLNEGANGSLVADDTSESVKAIVAEYRIVEEFKGEPNYKPQLVDLLGIGTGFVGLFPGKYYFVMLSPKDESKFSDFALVNICNTPINHYRLNVAAFQKQLDVMRNYRDNDS